MPRLLQDRVGRRQRGPVGRLDDRPAPSVAATSVVDGARRARRARPARTRATRCRPARSDRRLRIRRPSRSRRRGRTGRTRRARPGCTPRHRRRRTAITRMPADDSRKPSGPPTFPNPWITTRPPAIGKPKLGERGARHEQHAGRGRAGVATRAADRQRLAGDRRPACQLAPASRKRVHQPRHHAPVGVDVGRRHVAVGAEQRRDLPV